jgi:hypothetical protein
VVRRVWRGAPRLARFGRSSIRPMTGGENPLRAMVMETVRGTARASTRGLKETIGKVKCRPDEQEAHMPPLRGSSKMTLSQLSIPDRTCLGVFPIHRLKACVNELTC